MPARTIPIILKDGNTRNLRLEWEQLDIFEQKFGLSVLDVGRRIGEGTFSLFSIAGIIWAGLLHENKDLTFNAVEKLLETKKMMDYLKAINDLIAETFPFEEAEKNLSRPSPEAGTGKDT